MLKKKKRRLKVIGKRLAEIEEEYPSINFRDIALKHAILNHFELVKEMVTLKVDIKFCSTDNRKEMCGDCNCWKVAVNGG